MDNCYFKYTPFSTDSIKSILCDEIWHSRADKLNDPFELFCKPTNFGLPRDRSALTKHLEEMDYYVSGSKNIQAERDAYQILLLNNQDDLAHQQMTKKAHDYSHGIANLFLKKAFFISCLSKTEKEPLMWSHYAHEFKGICIAYNKAKLLSSDLHYHTVTYQEDVYTFDFFNVLKSFKSNQLNNVNASLNLTHLSTLSPK